MNMKRSVGVLFGRNVGFNCVVACGRGVEAPVHLVFEVEPGVPARVVGLVRWTVPTGKRFETSGWTLRCTSW